MILTVAQIMIFALQIFYTCYNKKVHDSESYWHWILASVGALIMNTVVQDFGIIPLAKYAMFAVKREEIIEQQKRASEKAT